jgi:transposase
MPKQYPDEVRKRAVRLVVEHRGEYETEYEAIRSVAAKLGIGSAVSIPWNRGGLRYAAWFSRARMVDRS